MQFPEGAGFRQLSCDQSTRDIMTGESSSDDEKSEEDDKTKLAAATLTIGFKTRTRSCKVEKNSVYGAAIVMPQLARSARWNKLFTALCIRSYLFLSVSFFVQANILRMLAKEEAVMDVYAGQMYLCDFGAFVEDCPDSPGCTGPGGTEVTPSRLYTYSQWSLRNFVKDSLKTVFPDRQADIAEKVDPGEYGIESYWCRWMCCAIFIVSVMDDLLACRDMLLLLYSVPTAAEPWMEMAGEGDMEDVPFGLDRVTLKIAGMPFSWKVVNTIIVLFPKMLLWKLTVETGTTFLMETAGIDDIIVNSVALSFILNFDEMMFNTLTTWETRQMLAKVEEFDFSKGSSWTHAQILQSYSKYQGEMDVDDADDAGRFGWYDAFRLLPLKFITAILLTGLSILEYYATHCTRTSEGRFVSIPMYLPKSVSFSFLNAFFPSFFPVEAEEDPFWQMSSV